MRIVLAILGMTLMLAGPAAAERRVALVIGNAAYAEAPLKNPVNDARAMAQSLRGRGFDVILRENAGKRVLEEAVAEFGERLSEDAVGLLFYAGHGIQVRGQNYMVPVDAKIAAEQQVRIQAVDVDLVLEQMAAARARVSVVILDACRNNPFERRFRSLGAGLAQMNAPQGTLIAYATAPGKVAADGDGANGLYTAELLRALREPGLKVEDVFKRVRVAVSRASNGSQVPWEASSLVGDFFFSAPRPDATAASPALAVTAETLERAFWDSIEQSTDAAMYQAYLERYPDGAYAAEARERAARYKPASMAAAPAARAAPAGPFDGRWTGHFGCVQHRQWQRFTRPVTVDVEDNALSLEAGSYGTDHMLMRGTVDSSGRIRMAGEGKGAGGWPYSVYISGRFDGRVFRGDGYINNERQCDLTLYR